MRIKPLITIELELDDLAALALCCFQQAAKERQIQQWAATMGMSKVAQDAESEYIRFKKLSNLIARKGQVTNDDTP